MNILNKIEAKFAKPDTPDVRVGDTLKISLRIQEGDKIRNQVLQGLVIAKKGNNARTTITVRRTASGVGVEQVIPLHSPNIMKIDRISRSKVRRAKLFYLRTKIKHRFSEVERTQEEVFDQGKINAEKEAKKAEKEASSEEVIESLKAEVTKNKITEETLQEVKEEKSAEDSTAHKEPGDSVERLEVEKSKEAVRLNDVAESSQKEQPKEEAKDEKPAEKPAKK